MTEETKLTARESLGKLHELADWKIENCIKLNITPIRASKEFDIKVRTSNLIAVEDGTYDVIMEFDSTENWQINSIESKYKDKKND